MAFAVLYHLVQVVPVTIAGALVVSRVGAHPGRAAGRDDWTAPDEVSCRARAMATDAPSTRPTGFPVTRAPDDAVRFRRDDGGRFVNLDGSGPHPFRDVWKWAVKDKLAGRRRKSPPRAAGAGGGPGRRPRCAFRPRRVSPRGWCGSATRAG